MRSALQQRRVICALDVGGLSISMVVHDQHAQHGQHEQQGGWKGDGGPTQLGSAQLPHQLDQGGLLLDASLCSPATLAGRRRHRRCQVRRDGIAGTTTWSWAGTRLSVAAAAHDMPDAVSSWAHPQEALQPASMH